MTKEIHNYIYLLRNICEVIHYYQRNIVARVSSMVVEKPSFVLIDCDM